MWDLDVQSGQTKSKKQLMIPENQKKYILAVFLNPDEKEKLFS